MAEELSLPERCLWDAFGRGDAIDFSGEDVGVSASMETAEWGEERTIRAGTIRALLIGAGASVAGKAAALRLAGVRITGVLDLSGAELRVPIHISGCLFTHKPELTWTRVRTVEFVECSLPGFAARSSDIDGNLVLRSCHISGETNLVGTRIRGQLDLGVRG